MTVSLLIIFNKTCSCSLGSEKVLRDIFKNEMNWNQLPLYVFYERWFMKAPGPNITIPITTSFQRGPDRLRKGIKTSLIIGLARVSPPTLVAVFPPPPHASDPCGGQTSFRLLSDCCSVCKREDGLLLAFGFSVKMLSTMCLSWCIRTFRNWNMI